MTVFSRALSRSLGYLGGWPLDSKALKAFAGFLQRHLCPPVREQPPGSSAPVASEDGVSENYTYVAAESLEYGADNSDTQLIGYESECDLLRLPCVQNLERT